MADEQAKPATKDKRHLLPKSNDEKVLTHPVTGEPCSLNEWADLFADKLAEHQNKG